MTKRPIEIITSVERRRRWSREEKERLVAACLEPDAVLSEIARAASTLVPVIVSEAASAAQPMPSEPSATSHSRRKRSDVTIELGRGRRVRVDSGIDTEALGRILDCVLGRR